MACKRCEVSKAACCSSVKLAAGSFKLSLFFLGAMFLLFLSLSSGGTQAKDTAARTNRGLLGSGCAKHQSFMVLSLGQIWLSKHSSERTQHRALSESKTSTQAICQVLTRPNVNALYLLGGVGGGWGGGGLRFQTLTASSTHHLRHTVSVEASGSTPSCCN